MALDSLSLLVLVGLVSIACQWFAWRIRIPAILPLLLAGLALGPGFHILDPDALFGELLFPLVVLSVAIILFEGSLTLRFSDLQNHGTMVRNLVTLGSLITWLIVTPSAHYFLNLSWELAFLFGAIVVVTGPTVIVPMLRTVRPKANIGNILRWEGIVIDPIGALLAVLVYEFVVSSQETALAHTLQTFGLTLAIGFGLGAAAGYFLGVALRRNWFPHYLENTGVLTLMLGAYALSNHVAEESGLLTVTVMGIWLANMKHVEVESILEFKETLSVLLISALFILLAARIDFYAISQLGWGVVFVLLVVIFVARPLSVLASSIGTSLNWRELALLSWIAPRGIVAAAVSALFALKLEEAGFLEAEKIVPMVFLVIITTVVLQSLTAGTFAKLLGVRAPAPQGLLIFGASAFPRALASELIKQDIPVKLADTNWDNIRAARMQNIPTYYGNPASEHAHRTLDLVLTRHLLILSPYRQLNPVLSYDYEAILGEGNVWGLGYGEKDTRASHKLAEDYARNLSLFGDDVTYGKLASLMARGAQIKTTPLTDAFTIEDYANNYGTRALPLIALDPNNRTFIYTAGMYTPETNTKENNAAPRHETTKRAWTPKAGWQIISLITPETEAKPTTPEDPQ